MVTVEHVPPVLNVCELRACYVLQLHCGAKGILAVYTFLQESIGYSQANLFYRRKNKTKWAQICKRGGGATVWHQRVFLLSQAKKKGELSQCPIEAVAPSGCWRCAEAIPVALRPLT